MSKLLEAHSPEAPASSCGDDNPNTVPPLAEDGPCDHSERRVELGTRNSSNCSNPASTESAEVESAPSVAMKRPKSKTESEPIKPYNSPPPKPTSPQVRAYLEEVNRFNEENTRRLQPAIAETMRPMREAAMREKHSADAKRAASEASTT